MVFRKDRHKEEDNKGRFMTKKLLILSLSLGIANPIFALKAGERHADPYKVMKEGQFIGQEIVGNSAGDYTRFLFAYQGDRYSCIAVLSLPKVKRTLGYRRYSNRSHSCLLLEPKVKAKNFKRN